jgi:hypothetical protein
MLSWERFAAKLPVKFWDSRVSGRVDAVHAASGRQREVRDSFHMELRLVARYVILWPCHDTAG